MTIFDLTNPDYKYKGILFAEIDNKEVFSDCPFPIPNESIFHGGIMAVIYVDENQIWRCTIRIKHLSGNKHVLRKEFGKESNCTSILQTIYNLLPMKNKIWTKNQSETAEGILEIIKGLDMIESFTVLKNE